nr:inositol monophosphatase family protein [Paracoccus versutus]
MGKRARGVRTICSGSLEMAMVACGRTSGYIGIKSDTVSHAATMPLVFAAGGIVTTADGRRATDTDEVRIASNGQFHDELVDIVNSAFSCVK